MARTGTGRVEGLFEWYTRVRVMLNDRMISRWHTTNGEEDCTTCAVRLDQETFKG